MLVYGVRVCGVQEVLEEHAACAGTLAKVKNDLARARNEAGIADHGVCHKMVQVTLRPLVKSIFLPPSLSLSIKLRLL
jgi:hypothetical protein